MQDIRQGNHAKKHAKPLDRKNKLSTGKPKLPAILTPENIQKARIAIRNSGKISSCDAILNANSSTILKWRKKFPKFGQAIRQALEEHKILTNKVHPEFHVMAMANLMILLQDRPMKEERETEVEIKDVKTGEIISIKRTRTTKRYTREPTWHAIEKVLGKKQLHKIIYETVKDSRGIENLSIVNQIFGEWIDSEILGSQWNGSIFNDMLDLMLIRTLQAETRRRYENGDMSFKEYNETTLEQTKRYGSIANNREKRAIKLLKGQSYFEILDMMQAQIQDIINIVEEVCNDVNIKKREIPNAVFEKVREIPRIQGFSAWSENKTTQTTE